MYPAIKDWLRYVNDSPRGGGWRSLTELPLIYFEPDPDASGALDPRAAKVYGDGLEPVPELEVRLRRRCPTADTWEGSSGIDRPSTAAFDTAIRTAGGEGIGSDFGEFSAGVAEWRAPDAPFRRRRTCRTSSAAAAHHERRRRRDRHGPPDLRPLRRAADTARSAWPRVCRGALPRSRWSLARAHRRRPRDDRAAPAAERRRGRCDDRRPSVVLRLGRPHHRGPRELRRLGWPWSDYRGDWDWSRDGSSSTRASPRHGLPGVTAPPRGRRGAGHDTARVTVSFSEPVSGVDEDHSSCAPGGRRVRARSSTRAAHAPPRSRRPSRSPTPPATPCTWPARSSTQARTGSRRPTGPSPRCGGPARIASRVPAAVARQRPAQLHRGPAPGRPAVGRRQGSIRPGPRAACRSRAESLEPPSSSSG